MEITSIVVDGVGKFGTRSVVSGLGSGVNILAAGNEAGKSTLFRAVRACLFERHNTKNANVQTLATEGLSLPITIDLGFDHGGQSYKITKSFIKSPTASLRRGGVEIARGREADEMLWELLGIAPGSSRSVDEAAFGILWVGQGQSFHVPAPTEAATTVLNAAIQAEVGALVGGERARHVLTALRDELAQLVTDTGRPKSGRPFAEATSHLETTERDLADVALRLAILDQQLAELSAKRSERARMAHPALLKQMEDDLEAAQESLKAGESAAALVAQFESAEQKGKAILDRVAQQLSDFEERRARIDSDRLRETELRDRLAPLQAQDAAARELVRQARKEIAGLDAEAERNEAQERQLQQIGIVVARAATRATLAHRRDALVNLSERMVRNAACLANNRATTERAMALDSFEREIALFTARLEAAAPEVAIEIAAAGHGKVSINDQSLSASAVRPVIDPLSICVADIATITITPHKTASAGDQMKRHDAQKKFAHILEEVGAESLASFRAARARRQQLETEAAALRAELAVSGVTHDSPALAIQELTTEIHSIDTLVAETLAANDAINLPSDGEIGGRQNALRQAREEARRQRQVSEGAIDAQTKILADVADVRGRLEGGLAEIQKRLQTDLAIMPDANREALLAAAEAAVRNAEEDYRVKAVALEEQRQKAPPVEELERRQNRVSRLKSALEAQKIRLGDLDRDIANLEGQIQNAGGDGLGEKAEELRQAREIAERQVAAFKERVEMLSLLKATIERCYAQQRDRLHAPLRRHLKPFLNDVFPSADIELGDGFSIAGIMRNGPTAEKFTRLSDGTQEQIAVLVRLGMGAMICDRGQPVPIVLDDALVFSDDDRIERMFDALNRAGLKQQVIVLTCRTRAFALLGGRQLAITEAEVQGRQGTVL